LTADRKSADFAGIGVIAQRAFLYGKLNALVLAKKMFSSNAQGQRVRRRFHQMAFGMRKYWVARTRRPPPQRTLRPQLRWRYDSRYPAQCRLDPQNQDPAAVANSVRPSDFVITQPALEAGQIDSVG